MSGLMLLRRPSHVICFSSRLSQVRRFALIGKPRASNEPRWALPKTPARTRFAPSPTGYLHLGSLRTALYNYLLAQATGGQFIIRVEDTDQARFVNDAEEVLYDDLRWAGLHWDEGPDKGGPFGPYKQSERLGLYTQHAKSLLESGHAFRCFCAKEDLDFNVQQATSSGGVAHYPGTCTHIEQGESDRRAANGEPHVVRFKSADKPVPAMDLVYGTYKKAEREDNFIIMKSDGFPTYHFANVVDDHFMKITHVIRGAEWLISTPKHVELYNAFGWETPSFAHVGLLVDGQRQKLSKRDMANIGIGVYRTNKIIPEALLNFSALLGWDPNLQSNTHLNKRGIMTLEEMKQNFTLKFTRGDIVVDLSKLMFFQKHLTRRLITGENPDRATLSRQIIQPILAEVKQLDKDLQEYRKNEDFTTETHLDELYRRIAPFEDDARLTESYVLQVLRTWKGTVDNPFHFVNDNIFAFYRPSKKAMRDKFHELQSNLARIMILLEDRQTLINADVSKVLRIFTQRLKQVDEDDWNAEKLGETVKQLTDSVKFYDTRDDLDKYESAGWTFMRHALINGQPGSAIVPLMLLLGKYETVHRIRTARKIASAEEDRLRTEAERAHQEKEALKVRNLLMGDPLGEKTKWNTDTRRHNNRNIEPRNVNVMNFPKMGKAPTPPGEGPFNIYLQKEKGRGEVREGPFKSRPPTPQPQRSPPKDPSEVERSPQFLSFREFKFGTRRIDLPKQPEDLNPAFWKLAELQGPQEAEHQTRQIPERVQGEWALPKHPSLRSKERPSGSREAGLLGGRDPSDVDHDHVKNTRESNIVTAVTRAPQLRSGTRTARPLAAYGLMGRDAAGGNNPTRDTKARDSKTGPFKIQAGNELPTDRAKHVKHLRALNRSLAFREAAAKRGEPRSNNRPESRRLEQLKATGPSHMSQLSIIKEKPQGVIARNTDDQLDLYGDGEQATASAPSYGWLAMKNGMGGYAGGTSLGVDIRGQRQAEAEWKAKAQARQKVEEEMARQWSNRHE